MLTRLLEKLADGQYHSGQTLSTELGVSRAAICQQMKKLNYLELPYSSIRGKGYRLFEQIELLDKARLEAQLTHHLDGLEVLLDVDSTNTYLFNKAADLMGQTYAVVAERQSAGKGRRGRVWVSPFGKNVYLSLLVTLHEGVAALEGLSLIVAVAVEQALTRLGVPNIGLKWPNDLYAEGKKLAGILLEVKGEYSNYCQVVIGVGLNLSLSEADAADIGQPWVALNTLKADLSRNQVVATVLNELLTKVAEFKDSGFAPYQTYWSEKDIFHLQEVSLISPRQTIHGQVKGVNRKGELLLKTERGMEVFNAGEVSVRAVD